MAAASFPLLLASLAEAVSSLKVFVPDLQSQAQAASNTQRSHLGALGKRLSQLETAVAELQRDVKDVHEKHEFPDTVL